MQGQVRHRLDGEHLRLTTRVLSHCECPRCGRTFDADTLLGVCRCGSPLLARYDLDAARRAVTPAVIAGRPPDLWRYRELLPVRDPSAVVTLGEGWTPLLPVPRYGRRVGLDHLLVKDEGLLPTGTFKARGAAVGVSRARELGVRHIAMPTNGNAGAAWAAYAARAGLRATIAMPRRAPSVPRRRGVGRRRGAAPGRRAHRGCRCGGPGARSRGRTRQSSTSRRCASRTGSRARRPWAWRSWSSAAGRPRM